MKRLPYRWTKAEEDDFKKRWLAAPQRCGHVWSDGAFARCVHCNRKFGPTAGRLCPKRKKPNRWKLHFRRAMLKAKYPRDDVKSVGTAAWLLEQMREIERDAKYLPYGGKRSARMPNEQAYWKFSRDARRYRRYLQQWWALPNSDVQRALPRDGHPARDSYAAWFTRERNKLAKRVKKEQCRQLQVGGTTYTFYADAKPVVNGRELPLFDDELQP